MAQALELMSLSLYTFKDISASQERLCHLLKKNYKSARAICWENIILHSHPEIEISFKFIPKLLMSKKCIHFFGPLCIFRCTVCKILKNCLTLSQYVYWPTLLKEVTRVVFKVDTSSLLARCRCLFPSHIYYRNYFSLCSTKEKLHTVGWD